MGIFPWLERKASADTQPPKSGYTLVMRGTNIFAVQRYNDVQLINHYRTVAPLTDAVDRIAHAISGLPICVQDRDEKGEKLVDHEVFKLLDNPNMDINRTRASFLQSIFIWRLLVGDSYILATGRINKPPLELFCLQPQHIAHFTDQMGFVNEYEYQNSTRSVRYKKDLKTGRFRNPTEDSELLHITSFNPDAHEHMYEGLGEVAPLFFEVEQYLHASQHNLSLLRNGARPSGSLVLTTKEGAPVSLSDEEFQRLKMQLDEQYAGSNNSGRPMLLEGGLEWREMSTNNKDMEWLSGKEDARLQIYRKLGIPLPLVTTDASSYNNVREAKAEFYEDRVIPLAQEALEPLGEWLLPRYPGGERLKFVIDKDKIGALAYRRRERTKMIQEDPTRTIAEKREEQGLPELEGTQKIVNANGDYVAGPDKPEAVAAPIAPTAPMDGMKSLVRLERKSLLDVSTAFEDPLLLAEVTGLAEKMYAELVLFYGAALVEEIAKASEFQRTQMVEDFIRQSSASMITNIDETTRKAVRQQLSEAITAGESLAAIRDRLDDVFDNALASRLDTIAVTETTKALGFASHEAMAQVGLDRTVWLSVYDGKTRDAHAYLNGRVSDEQGWHYVDGYRTKYPGGFGVASLDVNCRCAIRPALPGETKALGATDKEIWEAREELRRSRESVVVRQMTRIFELQRLRVLSVFDK